MAYTTFSTKTDSINIGTIQSALKLLDERFPVSERVECILSTYRVIGGRVYKCKFLGKLYVIAHTADLRMMENYLPRIELMPGLCGFVSPSMGIDIREDDSLVDAIMHAYGHEANEKGIYEMSTVGE